MDEGGWYDNVDKEKPWKNLLDLHFVSAMGPPGGGKTFITPRFLRHLNLISIANFDDDVMIKIFSTILQWFFIKGKFNTDVAKQENKIVTSTLDVYKLVFKELLPTPMKSHYLFNLRDFAKVIIGICLTDNTTLISQEQVVKIWTHEVMRVFFDRLVNHEDRNVLL
jgi:dynein heavy chain